MGTYCPDFYPARPPGSQVSTTGTKTQESSSLGEDFELYSSDSNADLEKE